MSKLRKKILLIFIPLNTLLPLLGIGYGTYIGFFERSGGEAFKCFFREHFGYYCPGCGGSRALFYLINFDFPRSFLYFPALLLAVIIIAVIDIFALVSFIKNDERILKKFNPNILILIPAVILLNFIIRNILLFFGIDYIGNFR